MKFFTNSLWILMLVKVPLPNLHLAIPTFLTYLGTVGYT